MAKKFPTDLFKKSLATHRWEARSIENDNYHHYSSSWVNKFNKEALNGKRSHSHFPQKMRVAAIEKRLP